jgi:hypothetical protein
MAVSADSMTTEGTTKVGYLHGQHVQDIPVRYLMRGLDSLKDVTLCSCENRHQVLGRDTPSPEGELSCEPSAIEMAFIRCLHIQCFRPIPALCVCSQRQSIGYHLGTTYCTPPVSHLGMHNGQILSSKGVHVFGWYI